jgi:enamine deaminase RidA (YjgF/YER057c/UK114 family)
MTRVRREGKDMADSIEDSLARMGVTLPPAAAPAANYVPFMLSGNLLFTAGQLPLRDGKLMATGLLGRDLDTAKGQEAARLCAVNILAQAKAALGDLEKISRIVKLTVFVASAPEFAEQHLVANGASDLLAAVLGDAGKHARAAVGTASLPLNAPVEIEAIIEVA